MCKLKDGLKNFELFEESIVGAWRRLFANCGFNHNVFSVLSFSLMAISELNTVFFPFPSQRGRSERSRVSLLRPDNSRLAA